MKEVTDGRTIDRFRPSPTADAPGDGAPPAGGAYWDYCPNCGHRLQNERCKYRCPRCHYFMSCSDFD